MGGTTEPNVADFHGAFAFEWVVQAEIDFSSYPNTTKWWAAINDGGAGREIHARLMHDSCVNGRTMIPPP